MTTSLLIAIGLALFFDFINGFHDAANSIATVVSTRVLRPHTAVLWAAFFNFIAFLFFETTVAATIGNGVVTSSMMSELVIVPALIGAISWNLITWYFGIPSSSSHALIGGLIGAGFIRYGSEAIVGSGVFKIVVSIVLSPLIGFVFAGTLALLVRYFFFRVRASSARSLFRKLQLFSAALYSLGHGANDAQKTMGIITALLVSSHYAHGKFEVPLWVILACHGAMGLGTLCGGWRIVKTMGMRITKLEPVGGFCAETGGALSLFLSTYLGVPVSTTHTITGSILAVGTVNKGAPVRWHIAERIVIAWLITIPSAAVIAALVSSITSLTGQ
jgi:inorganic phosphate transporter, PiT family